MPLRTKSNRTIGAAADIVADSVDLRQQSSAELEAALEYALGLHGDLDELAETLEIIAQVVRRRRRRSAANAALLQFS